MDPLAEVYDDATLRRVDRGRVAVVAPPSSPGRSRRAVGTGAVVSALALGLQAVFDPRAAEPIVEEIEPSAPGPEDPVRLWFVPGAPRLTRADVRPWLI